MFCLLTLPGGSGGKEGGTEGAPAAALLNPGPRQWDRGLCPLPITAGLSSAK